MASSDSRRNNGDHVAVEDDDEDEYEEIEVEEEEEEREEEEEDPEEEPEEAEEPEEEVKDEEEEEQVEYEEVEIEVEEEVTDDEGEDDIQMADGNGVVKSDSPVPMVADNEDGNLDRKSKDEVCLRSGDTCAEKSEASIVTDIHASEIFCPGGGCSADEQHNRDGKLRDGVCSRPGHASAMKSEANILTDTLASGTFFPDGRSSSRELHNGDGTEISSFVVSSVSPKLLEHFPGPSNDGGNSVKENQVNVDRTILVSTSEKHAFALDDVIEQSGRTTDAEEPKPLSDEADLHALPIKVKGKKESRSWFPQVRPRSLSPGAECEDSNKRPAISCEFFAKGWCIKGSSCRFLHKSDCAYATQVEGDKMPVISEDQHDIGSGHDVDASELLAYKSKSIAVQDKQKKHGENMKYCHCEDIDKTPMVERKISSSRVSVDSPKSSSCRDRAKSLSTPREVEADILKENHSLDGYGLPVTEGGFMLRENFFPRSALRDFGVSPGSDSIIGLVEESAAMRRRYSMDIQNSVPFYHISSYKGPFLHHTSPLLSRSNSKKFSDASYSQDLRSSFNYKTIFTPYNWEPSVPFQSSFIPPLNGSSDVQYDPFRDSIEALDAGHASLKQSSCGQTQNVQSISGQNSLELQKRLQNDNWDKSYSGNDKAFPAVGSESAATSASDAQNRNITEENPMVPGSVKALLKASRVINDGSSKLHSGLKVEKGRQPNELDDEETKIIRSFRADLVDFVKELMKPIWHEGRLSKDVYKVIVQKAEDKILSTIQPSQVPNTSESIYQYLSTSRPKISKLIQAYVDKYGRF